MDQFAFMIHPLDATDVLRKYAFAKKLPLRLVERMIRLIPPIKISDITGIQSQHGQAEGLFVACPLTSRQMVELPESYVLRRIINTGKYAEKLGAKVLGLGAMTSVVGDAGITIEKSLKIPVTTGNSYTVYTALEGTKKAAEIMGVDLKKAEILVIGATGSIGSICAKMLSCDCKFLTLVARDERKLEKLARQIYYETGLAVRIDTEIKKVLHQADIIIAVSSSVDTLIDAKDLKEGAIVCDVARPRSVSKCVAELRDDVLVIEGGLVEIPGDVDFNFNFGYPPKLALACMAETIILALEKRWESYTIGRELTYKQVEEMGNMAQKHGFKLAGFRSFERPVTEEQIKQIKALRARNGQVQCSL